MAEVWEILRLVPGGEGFSRLPDGRTGFAPGCFPGDRLEVTETEDHGSWVRARSLRLVVPSVERVEPACPVADRCGGCGWMRLGRAAQLREKAGVLREALVRIGQLRDLPDPLPLVAASPALGYRGRLRLHVTAAGKVGFFARGTRELVEVPGCVVAAPALERSLIDVRERASRHPGALAAFSEIELREAPLGPAVSLHCLPRDRARTLPATTRALLDELRGTYAVSVAGIRGPAGESQRWPLPGGVELSAEPGVFTQVNWSANLELIRAVVAGAQRRGARTFCDLYAGAGNFALPLAAAGLSGCGVERSRPAIDAARRAARAASLAGVEFFAGDARRAVASWVRQGRRFDLAVVDPPRSGARDLLPALLELGPPQIAMVSCDPATLARDLAQLVRGGYVVVDVSGHDLFPQTPHVEALAWLERAAPA